MASGGGGGDKHAVSLSTDTFEKILDLQDRLLRLKIIPESQATDLPTLLDFAVSMAIDTTKSYVMLSDLTNKRESIKKEIQKRFQLDKTSTNGSSAAVDNSVTSSYSPPQNNCTASRNDVKTEENSSFEQSQNLNGLTRSKVDRQLSLNGEDKNGKTSASGCAVTDDQTVYTCYICSKVFFQNGRLMCHLRDVHKYDSENIKDVIPEALEDALKQSVDKKCAICSRVVPNRFALIKHIQSHIGIRPYKCDVCGKDYPTVSNLNRHLRGVHKIDLPPQRYTGMKRKADMISAVYDDMLENGDDLAGNVNFVNEEGDASSEISPPQSNSSGEEMLGTSSDSPFCGGNGLPDSLHQSHVFPDHSYPSSAANLLHHPAASSPGDIVIPKIEVEETDVR